MTDERKPILISDVACNDCKGPVTMFGIPDKVWAGLGLTNEWVCLSCIAQRLAVALGNAEILEAIKTAVAGGDTSEINEVVRRLMWIQRRKFKLKRINRYLGAKVSSTAILVCYPGDDLGTDTLTMAEVQGNRGKQ